MIRKKEKRFEEFVVLVGKLEPIEYIGLCKMMKVKLVGEGGEILDFAQTLEQLMDRFLEMKKKPRRDLMEMLRAVAKQEDEHGVKSED